MLHDATWNDYENLHREMGKRGFARTITSGDGKMYQLPEAEYDFTGNMTAQQVRALAEQAAKAAAPRLSSAQLVTQSNARAWKGLSEVPRTRVA